MPRFRAMDLAPGFAPRASAGDNDPAPALLVGGAILRRSARPGPGPRRSFPCDPVARVSSLARPQRQSVRRQHAQSARARPAR
jgi:hypothetical protein